MKAKRGKKASPAWSTGQNRSPTRVSRILDRLGRQHPEARLILEFDNPFQLLCATILAAQATDVGVNKVTPQLFGLYPTPEDLARANFEDVATVVHSTGFFRQKTKRLIGVSQHLVERFGGEVPQSLEELTSLPGIGKKTAIIVLNHGFGVPSGVAVDTHVKRISHRLDWSHQSDPDKVEDELRRLIPRDRWITLQDLLAFHGRAHCRAPKPSCSGCPIGDLCYFPDKSGSGP